MNTSRVRKLAEVLLQNPKYVSIDYARADEVAHVLNDNDFSLDLPKWDFAPFYPQSDDFEEMCQFYLTFNSINYCYFDQDGKKFQEFQEKPGVARTRTPWSGSSLAAIRLTESWDEIKDPFFLSNVDENYLLTDLFHAESPISLVKERTEALREVGRFLNENSGTSDLFQKLFCKYKKNAYYVSQALPIHLPSWRDPFFKRAQLFVGMVYGRFQDWSELPINADSLEDLTVFADYRVPETLIRMGIIVPRAPLLTKLHRREFLGSGSQKELELRAATIVGADAVMNVLNTLDEASITPLHMDYLLWSAGRKTLDAPDRLFVQSHITHHLTMTTDY